MNRPEEQKSQGWKLTSSSLASGSDAGSGLDSGAGEGSGVRPDGLVGVEGRFSGAWETSGGGEGKSISSRRGDLASSGEGERNLCNFSDTEVGGGSERREGIDSLVVIVEVVDGDFLIVLSGLLDGDGGIDGDMVEERKGFKRSKIIVFTQPFGSIRQNYLTILFYLSSSIITRFQCSLHIIITVVSIIVCNECSSSLMLQHPQHA